MSLHFDELFRKKLQKVRHFVKKHEKPSILAKTCNFWSKLRCLGIFMNFSERSCKKCLISWKSTRNHRFRQNLQLFEKTTMLLLFDELYGKNLQKLPHFVKKHENSSIWRKLCNFFEETTMFWCFDELFSKRLQKVSQLVKKHEKSSIWPKLCTFSNKLPCLCISMNFSERRFRKCVVSWKSTGNHRFSQHLQLFEKTTMFLRFDELYGKNLQKLPHFVKKHENSSIWPKLTTSWTNYHVSAFWSAFQQKVVKSIVGAYQAQAIITGFATSICCFHLCRDWGNDFWNYVSRSTGVLG